MKKYLWLTGFVLLIAGLYLFSNIMVGMVYGFYLGVVMEAEEGVSVEPAVIEETIMQHNMLISLIGALLALVFLWVVFVVKNSFSDKQESIFSYCRLKKTPSMYIAVALLMGIGFSFFLNSMLALTQVERYFPEHQELMKQLMHHPNILLSLLGVGLVVPLVEEIAFRGIIFNRMREDLPLIAALFLQALVFGAIHLNYLQSGYAFIGGILLGLVYMWAGSLWVPLALHVGWNITSIIVIQVVEPEVTMVYILSTFLIGLVLVVAGIIFYKRRLILK